MAGFVVNKAYELTVAARSIDSNQMLNNVLHLGQDPSSPPTDPGTIDGSLALILAGFIAQWRLAVCATVSEVYRVDSYSMRLIEDWVTVGGVKRLIYGDMEFAAGDPNLDVGVLIGDYLPTFNAMSVRKITGVAGRNFRGGFRIGPVTEASTDSDNITQLVRTTATPPLTQLLTTPYSPAAADPQKRAVIGVFSRKLFTAGLVGNVLSAYWRPCTQALVNQTVGSQTSRKKKGGGL